MNFTFSYNIFKTISISKFDNKDGYEYATHLDKLFRKHLEKDNYIISSSNINKKNIPDTFSLLVWRNVETRDAVLYIVPNIFEHYLEDANNKLVYKYSEDMSFGIKFLFSAIYGKVLEERFDKYRLILQDCKTDGNLNGVAITNIYRSGYYV
jgi:hypothetical protein